MAQCLGHKSGTDCKFISRSTQKRENWENWQLCMKCARKLHPEFYKDKKNHGVRSPSHFENKEIPFGIIEIPTIQ